MPENSGADRNDGRGRSDCCIILRVADCRRLPVGGGRRRAGKRAANQASCFAALNAIAAAPPRQAGFGNAHQRTGGRPDSRRELAEVERLAAGDDICEKHVHERPRVVERFGALILRRHDPFDRWQIELAERRVFSPEKLFRVAGLSCSWIQLSQTLRLTKPVTVTASSRSQQCRTRPSRLCSLSSIARLVSRGKGPIAVASAPVTGVPGDGFTLPPSSSHRDMAAVCGLDSS